MTIENAHVKGTETGSLVFSIDGRTVLTRGGDDTVKRTCALSHIDTLTDGNSQCGIFGRSKSPLRCILDWTLCIRAQMRYLARMINMFSPGLEPRRRAAKDGW